MRASLLPDDAQKSSSESSYGIAQGPARAFHSSESLSESMANPSIRHSVRIRKFSRHPYRHPVIISFLFRLHKTHFIVVQVDVLFAKESRC